MGEQDNFQATHEVYGAFGYEGGAAVVAAFTAGSN